MKRLNDHAGALALAALVVAIVGVGVAGASAGGVFVTTKQIRNGTILSQDIRKNAVKSSDIGKDAVGSTDVKAGAVESAEIASGAVQSEEIDTGAVQTGDIGDGQVQPGDVDLPEPEQIQESDVASAVVGDSDFALVNTVGTYMKEDATSILDVTWTGTAVGVEVPCVFQIRVDGKASAAGAGVVYVGTSAASVSAAALFEGLPAGPHTIEVWAKLTDSLGSSACTVGPASAGISQTFVVSEQVV